MSNLVGGISSAGRALHELDGQSLQIDRASGAFLWDETGRRFVDTAMGFGATVLGHNHPEVLEAIISTQRKMLMPAFAHRLETQAAEALTSCTGALDRVIFVNTGSEAVHLACRTARAVTGRKRIVKFAAGYDGWFDQVAFGNAGSGDALMAASAPAMGDANKAIASAISPSAQQRPEYDGMLLLRYNDFADVDRLFAEYANVAGVLIEPVLANAGCVEPAPGYLKHLADTAHRHGALVILDEVLMGFRLHAGLCGHLEKVDADLATVGKAIGSGVAVAALLGKQAIMTCFEDGRVNRAGTYSGNPPACAAVIATIALLKQQDYTALLQQGNTVRATMQTLFNNAGVPVTTTGYGTVFTLWPSASAPSDYAQAAIAAKPAWTKRLHDEMRRRGALTMPFAFGRFYLSFAHDEAALGLLMDACAESAPLMASAATTSH